MVRSVTLLLRDTIHAADGDIGTVQDLYFEDVRWTVRHLVAAAGHWLSRQYVLIPPLAVREIHDEDRTVHVAMTKAQIANSPPWDSGKPVSRQQDVELYRYFGFPYEWERPIMVSPVAADHEAGDPHLRSAREVIGYHVEGADGEIGHVDDLLLQDDPWAIRYLVIATRHWLPGKKIPVPREWAVSVQWGEAAIHVGLKRDTIRQAPGYDPDRPLDAGFEARLSDYYGRPNQAGRKP